MAGFEEVFERVRSGREAGIGVYAVEGVAFGLRKSDEAEAARAIEVEEFGEHFRVESADVHEKDVGDVAMVESV